MRVLHRKPTGFSKPEYYERELDVHGFVYGEVENTARMSGTIKGVLAVCTDGDQFVTVPVSQLTIIESGSHDK